MKFSLFCLMSLLMADVCSAGRIWQDVIARMRKRRSVAPAGFLDIHVRSEGCNDPGKAPNTCGIAYIKVNGRDHSPHVRGHNVVVVDATTGAVTGTASFDTHGDSGAGNRLRDYLNGIHGDKIACVAVQDEGSRYVSAAFDALKRLGATDPILTDFRGSFAFCGYARVKKPSWVAQQQANSGQGPSVISFKVPFTPHPYVDVHVRSEGCEDPGKAPNTCGIAYINVDGTERSLRRRGHNVVIVDAGTGSVLDVKSFDTHGDNNAGNGLRDYLNGVRGNKIVLIAVQDEGTKFLSPAVDAIKGVGGVDPVMIEYRGSFALVGYADAATNRPVWIAQQVRGRAQGPSVISSRIPLSPSRPPSVDVDVRSEGCNDPQKTPNTCGIAYIRVNGKDHSPHIRGHNVVVLDEATGSVLDAKAFDTHGVGSAGNSLRDFLNNIQENKIVLVAVQDEGSRYMSSAVDALKRLGAVDPVTPDHRGSYALVGNPRTVSPPWITQQRRLSAEGPSEININIPLSSNCLGALGSENGGIPDGQLSASTEWDAHLNIPMGRLRSARSWSARVNDANQWYQVDLGSEYTKVTGTATQGRGDHPQWVTKYKLQYSKDGVNFNYYREQGAVKEFLANTDQHTVVYHVLIPPIMARYIRFKILTWHGHISMRAEVYGCPGCRQALGMENGVISDEQISASSQWDANHAAVQGRLHFKAGGGKQGAWSARANDVNQWLQIDLGNMYTKVTRVASQGRQGSNQWVTKYKLQYSTDGVNFQYYKDEGQAADKEFLGNADQNTVVYHALYPAVSARYIRFRPLVWHNHVSMRVEVYGCQGCRDALGMESGVITDGQISASSQWDANHAAVQGRLHFKAGGGKQGAWSARTNDVNQWLQINLNGYVTLTHVASQGRNAHDQWVTKYKLQYSTDGTNFQYYQEQGKDKEFPGNTDRDTVVSHQLNPPVEARFVRFRPVTWKNHISMRVELYGCASVSPDHCANSPCQNEATCVNLQAGYRCDCKTGYSGDNCETDINECAPAPCQNGGTCVDLVGSYRCDCKTGYSGTNCETDVNECAPAPCQNGGTCVDLVGSYRCDCKTGYSGDICQTDINECAPAPCQNGGTCVDLVGSYRCDCKTGYSGNDCETDINECAPAPCQNGGTCVDLVGSYRCDCKTGYSGNNCQTDINECSPDPCQNGGTCVDLVGSYRCDCKTGYSGTNCETDINECAPAPCQNSGTCVDLVGSYRCDCKTGYSGNNCETDINECSPDPCQNGGTCVDLAKANIGA